MSQLTCSPAGNSCRAALADTVDCESYGQLKTEAGTDLSRLLNTSLGSIRKMRVKSVATSRTSQPCPRGPLTGIAKSALIVRRDWGGDAAITLKPTDPDSGVFTPNGESPAQIFPASTNPETATLAKSE